MATEILVFVPGVLGSELWDGDDRIWPGSVFDAIGGFSDAKFALLRKPDLEPRDIVRSAAGGLIGVYRTWIEAFEKVSRDGRRLFVEDPPGGEPKTLHVFPYDWRLDLRRTAGALADFLDAIVKNTDGAGINLVCHSMGGLVARYYLESGKFTGRPAFARISLLATLGTPHNGAPVAYAGAAGLHKTTFLSLEQTRILANDPRYPSLYQLFPDKTHSFIWARDPAAAFKEHAADDAAIAGVLGLHPASLAAWMEFRAALGNPRPPHVRYFFIVGSRQETIVRLLWDGARLQLVELEDSGDGTVSLPGAMVASTQSEFVGKSHASLIETRPARQTLAGLFGATTRLSASELALTVTLAVRDLSVTTDDEIHVQIEFHPQVDHFKGELVFEHAVVSDAAAPPVAWRFAAFPQLKAVPIELTGTAFTYVNLKTGAIDIPGIYRPVLRQDGSAAAVVGPAFAVQPAT